MGLKNKIWLDKSRNIFITHELTQNFHMILKITILPLHSNYGYYILGTFFWLSLRGWQVLLGLTQVRFNPFLGGSSPSCQTMVVGTSLPCRWLVKVMKKGKRRKNKMIKKRVNFTYVSWTIPKFSIWYTKKNKWIDKQLTFCVKLNFPPFLIF